MSRLSIFDLGDLIYEVAEEALLEFSVVSMGKSGCLTSVSCSLQPWLATAIRAMKVDQTIFFEAHVRLSNLLVTQCLQSLFYDFISRPNAQ